MAIIDYIEGSHNERSALVEQVQVQKIGDRFFLTGRAVKYGDPDNPVIGHIGWLPVESIVAICEANSADYAKKIIYHSDNKTVNRPQNDSPPDKDLQLPSYLGLQDK